MHFFTEPILLLIRYRILLQQTVKQELLKRYTGSFFGIAWIALHPLLFLGVYAAIYILIFKVRFQLFNSNEYVLLIFCGLIPFLGFSDALGSGVGCVVSNSSLIKNTLFPIELVPVMTLLASQAIQVVGTLLLLIAIAVVKGLTAWMLLLPLVWLAQIMFMAGMLWVLSGLNVFFRDLQHIISTVILLLMLISPIAYTMEMVPKGLKPLIAVNPIAHFVFSYQRLLLLGEPPPAESVIFIAIASLLLFFIGYAFFIQLKKVLVDNV